MIDGLEIFSSVYQEILFDPYYARHSSLLEMKAKRFRPTFLSKGIYTQKYAGQAAAFVHDVNEWSQLYLDLGITISADPAKISGIFFDFFNTQDDLEKMRHLKRLYGRRYSPSSREKRLRIRQAIVLARFLDPVNWGILSWRVLAMMKSDSILDLRHAYMGMDPSDICQAYESLSEDQAMQSMEMIRGYRRPPDLLRAVDVTNSLFALSLQIWPPGKVIAVLA